MKITKNFYWLIDSHYKNTGSKNDPKDEFIRKIWVDIDKNDSNNANWTIPNSGGIRGLAKGKNGIKKISIDKAAIFCITAKHNTGSHNPWEDSINYFSGQIRYWGDAKAKKGKRIDDFNGNKYLNNIYDQILEGKYSEVPPILHFTNIESGKVRFNGLCAIEDVKKKWIVDSNKRILNYQFTMAILDCNQISTEWIKHRAKFNQDDHPDCPEIWKKYKKDGSIKRLQAWRSRIRTDAEQLPKSGSKEEKFLNHLSKLDWKIVEENVVKMLQKNTVIHTIEQTRITRDGGMDMVGKFSLPDPFAYEISFKGEVKRHKGGIGPDKVSRLVARLGRGEYGLFFTTSYFTKQAQEEVIEDNYPIRLFSGIDLYNLFNEADMISDGNLII